MKNRFGFLMTSAFMAHHPFYYKPYTVYGRVGTTASSSRAIRHR